MTITKWPIVSQSQAFKKYSRRIDQINFTLPNGQEADFYVKQEGPATSVLALTDDQHVILVRQFRVGPNEILDEIPGGYVDEGETPLEAATRELLEETGYEAGNIEFVIEAFDDAYSTMRRNCFVATNCKKVGEPSNTDTEQTEVVLMTIEAFRDHLRSGQLTDVETGYLGLDHLKLL